MANRGRLLLGGELVRERMADAVDAWLIRNGRWLRGIDSAGMLL